MIFCNFLEFTRSQRISVWAFFSLIFLTSCSAARLTDFTNDNKADPKVALAFSDASLVFDKGLLYTFPSIPINTVSTLTLVVTNEGDKTALTMNDSGSLAAPFRYKGGSYPGTGGTCATTLKTEITCTLVVEYAPTAAVTSRDRLDLSYNDSSDATVTRIYLNGTANSLQALLSISSSPLYDYGTRAVASSTDHSFTITNLGTGPATSIADGGGLAAPFDWKGGTYPGTGGTCGVSLAAAATCTVIVTYSPVATGLLTDTLLIDYDDGIGAVTLSENVKGTGALALLSLSDGPTYTYGSKGIGSTTSKTFTITNSGGFAASSMADAVALAAPFDWKGGIYPGTGGTCGTTLAASSTCTILVNFAPTSTGTFNDTIDVSYNDGQSPQNVTRDVTGIGALAILAISDAPTYDYGTKALGSVTSKTFTITNSGGLSATSLAYAGGLAAPYTFKGGSYPGTGGTCGTTLAASATCTILINFSPTSTGTFNDTIDLSYSDGQASQNATRAVTGIGALAVLAISDGVTYDYGTVNVSSTVSKTFTITNSGGVGATVLAYAGGLAAPYAHLTREPLALAERL